jgi:putative hydrolase of the HAD superfamily
MVRAVFFDSGHTLVRPLGGSWFPGHHFFAVTRSHGLEIPDDSALPRALDEGFAYLDANHRVASLPQEEAQFVEYYRIVLGSLGLAPSPDLLAELSRGIVHRPNFEPYPDTRSSLERLRQAGLPLAVITDAWPSVETKFTELGFRDYFSAFVISSVQGCTKPAPGMFEPALRAIGVAADQVLFVDDGPDLVEAARAMGFRALLMDREATHPPRDGVIRDLEAVVGWVRGTGLLG